MPAAAAGGVIAPAPAERINAVDRVWLEMGGDHNPMVVAAVLEFDRVHVPALLGERILARLAQHPRFRQRIVGSDRRQTWVEDEPLHHGYHVHVASLHEDDLSLRTAIGIELAQPLDRTLPLWRLTVYPRGQGRVAVLFRAHHAVGDGIAMLQLLLDLVHGATPTGTPLHHGPLDGLIRRLELLNGALEGLAGLVAEDLKHPEQLAQQLADSRRTLAAVLRVLALPDDNPAALATPPCGRRAVAWAEALTLRDARALAHAQGVTVNDLFLAALAGAFGRYLRDATGSCAESQNLRVSVPVNLRARDDHALGNRFGLVLVDLPVGLAGWHARLDVVAERMAALKRSPEARAVLGAMAVAGHLPVGVQRQLVQLVAGKAAAVVSNLPGPPRMLEIEGTRLRRIVFWPPQAGSVGIGVSLLSYAGRLTVGISTDTAQIAHPQRILDAFAAELAEMMQSCPPRAPRRRPAARARVRAHVHAD